MALERTLPITHRYGLHARASTRFVEIAQKFCSDIRLSRENGTEVDGKSVLGLLTLGAQLGDNLTLRIQGADAEQAMEALSELVRSDFGGI